MKSNLRTTRVPGRSRSTPISWRLGNFRLTVHDFHERLICCSGTFINSSWTHLMNTFNFRQTCSCMYKTLPRKPPATPWMTPEIMKTKTLRHNLNEHGADLAHILIVLVANINATCVIQWWRKLNRNIYLMLLQKIRTIPVAFGIQ